MTITTERMRQAIREHGSQRKAALALGINESGIRQRLNREAAKGLKEEKPFVIEDMPETDIPLGEFIELRKKIFDRKITKSKWAKLIPVTVKLEGPICVGVFGDPHVDDDGCDIRALERDLNIISKHPYMLGLNIGDITNNWIGRLEKKYGDQTTTRAQAAKLLEWVLVADENGNRRNWLAVILGNHDLWNNGAGTIQLLNRGQGVTQEHGVRMALNFPSGDPIRIHARHDFPGNSQHNNTHAMRRELEFGFRDHILVAGHRHIDGYQIVPNPAEGFASHLARVSGYKILDDYADMCRFLEYRMNPSTWFVLQPDHANPAERIKPFFDGEAAKDYTEYLRRKK